MQNSVQRCLQKYYLYCGLQENICSESHILRKGAKEFLILLSIFCPTVEKSRMIYQHKMLLNIWDFREIRGIGGRALLMG